MLDNFHTHSSHNAISLILSDVEITRISLKTWTASWHRARPDSTRLHSLVKVEIGQIFRGLLRQGHLLVIVDHPLAIPQDVAHIVAHVRWRPHVADERYQFVFWEVKKKRDMVSCYIKINKIKVMERKKRLEWGERWGIQEHDALEKSQTIHCRTNKKKQRKTEK